MAREQRIGGVACCYYCTEEVGGWCSSLAFVGSRGVGDGLGLSVSVTNWDFAFFLFFGFPNSENPCEVLSCLVSKKNLYRIRHIKPLDTCIKY